MLNLEFQRFTSEEEIKAALAEYNQDKPEEKHLYYCSYYDSCEDKRFYIVCTKEYFYAWRNMIREEHQKKFEDSRCQIISDRYKNTWILCRHKDCATCPHKNKVRIRPNGKVFSPGDEIDFGNILSIDRAVEDYKYELPEDKNVFYSEEDPAIETLNRVLKTLCKMDRKIINLYYYKKKTDKEIADILNEPKSTITSRRNVILKEIEKNFD